MQFSKLTTHVRLALHTKSAGAIFGQMWETTLMTMQGEMQIKQWPLCVMSGGRPKNFSCGGPTHAVCTTGSL